MEDMYYISKGLKSPNGKRTLSKITICGKIKGRRMNIGVAKCGNDENYDLELGKEIAAHRADIQPYAQVPISKMSDPKESFDLISTTIVSHIRSSKQWNPNLKRIK